MAETLDIIKSFYSAFNERDFKSMANFYHEDLKFSDPVFQDLDYKRTCAMWHMLCERGKDLSIVASEISTNDDTGKCRWDAHYTFSATGNRVHNIINAAFVFKDEKIVNHLDTFDFWRWSRQALGTSGLLLGWSPMVRNKVRKTAMMGLEKFVNAHPTYQ